MIKVENLTKKFNDFMAVDNISFSVNKGEIFAFLGPNGAGKTTTIRMLTTLLKPTSGKIKINGYDPLRNQDEVRQSFGIVFQDPSLDEELTAQENMEFHGVIYQVPKKIRQVEVARGLIHHPKILFLDEPTLGLDPQTRSHIWSHIKNLNREERMTVFFTTHYMEETDKVAQKIAIIDHGKIIVQGTPEELKQQTKTASLEEAFLAFTGKTIREEEISPVERMRMRRRIFRH